MARHDDWECCCRKQGEPSNIDVRAACKLRRPELAAFELEGKFRRVQVVGFEVCGDGLTDDHRCSCASGLLS